MHVTSDGFLTYVHKDSTIEVATDMEMLLSDEAVVERCATGVSECLQIHFNLYHQSRAFNISDTYVHKEYDVAEKLICFLDLSRQQAERSKLDLCSRKGTLGYSAREPPWRAANKPHALTGSLCAPWRAGV